MADTLNQIAERLGIAQRRRAALHSSLSGSSLTPLSSEELAALTDEMKKVSSEVEQLESEFHRLRNGN